MPTTAVNEFVLTTDLVKEIKNKENLGKILKRYEKLWFSNLRGVRKANITFAMTDEEFEEYVKCKLSVHYFAETYCKIKLEDGTVGHMKLRKYQKDILNLYANNRFSILMASRQVGKCSSPFTNINILDEKTNDIYTVPFYEVYYKLVMLERKLKFPEKIKYILYKIYYKI